MWPYAEATLRLAGRSVSTWVLCGLGIFAGLFAVNFAILALADVAAQSHAVLIGTCQLFSVLLVIWLLGRALDDDSASGFVSAADATGPGVSGRVLGRWAGAVLAGVGLALLVGFVVPLFSPLDWPPLIHLLIASFQAAGLVAAWIVLLGARWHGGGAALAAFLLWLLGHLPWGAAPFPTGPAADALRAWLPGPREASAAVAGLGPTTLAIAGVLLLALALTRHNEV